MPTTLRCSNFFLHNLSLEIKSIKKILDNSGGNAWECLLPLKQNPYFSLLISESKKPASFKHKHILQLVALEYGFKDWQELKNFSRDELPELFYPRYASAFLNHWFNNLKSAEAQQAVSGGYLLPYRHQFFVAEKDFITAIGLPENHSSWEKIGYNLVRPKQFPAWKVLMRDIITSFKYKKNN